MHHLARRRRQVPTDLERVGIGLRHLPLGHVGEHALEAGQQILAAGLDRLFQHRRVGGREVRRAHRIDETLHREAHLLLLLRVEPFDSIDIAEHVVGDEKIALADPVEHGVFAPARIAEAFVGIVNRWFGRRGERVEHALPQLEAVGPEIARPFDRRGIGQAGYRRHRTGHHRQFEALLHHLLLQPAEQPGPVLHIGQAGYRRGGILAFGHQRETSMKSKTIDAVSIISSPRRRGGDFHAT